MATLSSKRSAPASPSETDSTCPQNNAVHTADLLYGYLLQDGPVEVRETHISWVFLTDRFAIKLKKPVRFEFLDFSTAELRREACQHELSLNRRLAPDVYLSIQPVVRTAAGQIALGGDGERIDTVVKMRRLRESATLEQRLRKHQLTTRHIQKLADFLAAFYTSQAPAMVQTAQHRERLRHHIDANRDDLLRCAAAATWGGAKICQGIHRAHAAQCRYLRVHQQELDNRVCDGRIVDGHGDLRPEHVYFTPDPVILDCVEFNAEYRINDIVDDLAYLAMECDLLAAPAIGEALLAAYERESGDRIPADLFAFYKCYRACVRAKIAALRFAQLDESASDAARLQLLGYLQLADQTARKLGPPLVILVGGLMGTGKSTLAWELARQLEARLLQSDLIRSEMLDCGQLSAIRAGEPSETPGDGRQEALPYGAGRYSLQARTAVYDRLFELAGQSLEDNPTVVLDASFSRRSLRNQATSLAAAAGARVLQVQCDCPRSVAVERITERLAEGTDHSEARPELFDQQARDYEAPLPDVPCCQLDTTTGLASQVEHVLQQIAQLARA